MLRIYEDVMVWLVEMGPVLEGIGKRDSDLARQLGRSSKSVALNLAEGMAARGKMKTHCYGVALREARESHTAMEIGVRLGMVSPLDASFADRTDKIIATLVRLACPKRAG